MRWAKDAPDHWSARAASYTLAVWRSWGCFHWELWGDGANNPMVSGDASDLADAKAKAESAYAAARAR